MLEHNCFELDLRLVESECGTMSVLQNGETQFHLCILEMESLKLEVLS